MCFAYTEFTAAGGGRWYTLRARCECFDRHGVLWYPPTGREAIFSGTFTDRASGGLLVEHRAETDDDGLLDRLGLPRPR